MLNQHIASVWISLETSKMQSSEAIAAVLLIEPLCYLLWSQILVFTVCQQYFDTLGTVIEGALVQQGSPTCVYNVIDFDVTDLLQISLEFDIVVAFDNFSGF